ncbi:ATP-dependent sacrificial sulfur transferase LarE [Amycolatopsis sp. K13G38]|uniref:ATP-dependent sacrificial sulfur transferase LarE n=1 Tax=Amycolatopsis acididurans TaxID=2724524 RepID=A0ABX1IYS7_9PSEU|nr:ATP-dependent sacrificial sulfur transferase LarE [Amycolatopsis acididurans]NKQ52678.1 ATP-dependent sacrificial sulfur transferase LarE [Amycolatopsis acididurans]
MTEALPAELAAAEERVAALLRGRAPLGVAFSGGVDSSVLLALAVRTLGADGVRAIVAVSPSLPERERLDAREIAALVGAPVVELPTREGERAAYRANGPDRCYHCKHELFDRIWSELPAREGLAALAYGENADDIRRADRPGGRAAREFGVLRPLADAGIGKATVRALARALGLPNADKPAAPCLASRIPHFSEVTPAKLAQVEKAENALRELGFRDLRVRHHGDVARVELLAEDLVRAAAAPLRDRVRSAVLDAGFRFVAVDLGGLQSGALTLPLVDVRG